MSLAISAPRLSGNGNTIIINSLQFITMHLDFICIQKLIDNGFPPEVGLCCCCIIAHKYIFIYQSLQNVRVLLLFSSFP